MKKIILYLVITLFNIGLASAQVKGTINYKLTINDGALLKPRIENFTLYFFKSSSIELPSNVPSQITEGDISESEGNKVYVIGKPTFVYKNFSDGNLMQSDEIGFKRYLIKDTLLNFKWVISKEKSKILNFNCTKATVNFRGRKYVAWYTDDVPLQNGPWKFCGLPGLIVKIYDDKAIYTYEINGINLKDDFNVTILKVPNAYLKDKAISHTRFMSMYNKKLEENVKLSKVVLTGKDGGSGTLTMKLPQKIERF